MQAIGGLDEFRCFAYEGNNNSRFFIYWIREEQIVGVTDGMEKVFEAEINRFERRKLLGNVADSRLEDEWREAFENGTFEVKELDNDHVSIVYVLQKQSLTRLKEDVPQRISQLFNLAISALNKKARKASNAMNSKQVSLKAKKSPQKSENHSVIDPSKRKRSRPTGLQFED
uniref:Uncharacterized protein n=1 Tax=Parascaris univalens TaxID=6257 RepID=A0A915CE08_PARUN